MADLPPMFILTIEVDTRIDRKCQKNICTYSGEKILSAKIPHVCIHFYNKLCRVSEKSASFSCQQS